MALENCNVFNVACVSELVAFETTTKGYSSLYLGFLE